MLYVLLSNYNVKIDHRISLSRTFNETKKFIAGFHTACVKNNVKIVEMLINIYPYII